MRVAHLARKPLSENSVGRNVMEHGTGGINIDGNRIFAGTEHYRSRVTVRNDGMIKGADSRSGKALGRFQAGYIFLPTNHPGGRWPANLVLVHLTECHRENEAWECVESCPVKELDEQSGELHSQNPLTRKGRPGEHGTGQGTTYLSMKPTGEHYADKGGASRFFKQVKEGLE